MYLFCLYLLKAFYFGIILELQKLCKESTESFHILFAQVLLMLTSYIAWYICQK